MSNFTYIILVLIFATGIYVSVANSQGAPITLGNSSVSDLLVGKDVDEKATIKSQEIAKIKTMAKQSRNSKDFKGSIEVIDTIHKGKAVEVYVRAWGNNGKQIGFGKDGTVDIERFVVVNPPILVPDPNGTIEIDYEIDEEGTIVTRKYREDLEEVVMQVIEQTISKKKEKFDDSKIIKDKVGNTTTTVYPDNDGRMREIDLNGQTWANIVGGTGDQVNIGNANRAFLFRGDGNTDRWDIMDRSIFTFDISSISGTDEISSATLSFTEGGGGVNDNTGDADLGIYEATPASDSVIVAGDYDAVGTTLFATTIALSTISVEETFSFTINATGITYLEARIDDDGIANIGTRNDNYDAEEERSGSSAPVWVSGQSDGITVYNIAEAGTTKDPVLVIEHAPPGAAVVEGNPYKFIINNGSIKINNGVLIINQ